MSEAVCSVGCVWHWFVCDAPYLNVVVVCCWAQPTNEYRHGEMHFSIANQSTTTSIMNGKYAHRWMCVPQTYRR